MSEIDRLIAAGESLARRAYGRFVLDPAKVANFPGGKEWLIARAAQADKPGAEA